MLILTTKMLTTSVLDMLYSDFGVYKRVMGMKKGQKIACLEK